MNQFEKSNLGEHGPVSPSLQMMPHIAQPKRWSATVDDILNALSGLVYVTSRSGEMLAFGVRNWDAFACANSGQDVVASNLLGQNLFECIRGSKVRDVYRSIHATLIEDDRAKINFEYRCDAPDLERRMLMSVSALISDDGEVSILYQSQILDERMRAPLPIFAYGEKSPTCGEGTSICNFCAKIAWPVGAPGARQDWISAESYYAKGGSSHTVLDHGICPECFDKSQNQWRQ